MVVSSAFDNTLETAFIEIRKKFVVAGHAFTEGEPGRIVLKYSDRDEPEQLITAEDMSGLNLLENGYSVIYKLCGCFSLFSNGSVDNLDTLMISEKDFFRFSKYLEKMVPRYITRQFLQRSFLFFGYNINQWHERLVATGLLEKRLTQSEPSYAVIETPTPYEKAFWQHNRVNIYPVGLAQFVDGLTQRMTTKS